MSDHTSAVRGRQLTVDVVIPVFNGENFLLDAVNSVLQQSFPASRIIIVDDGSSDSTPIIAQRLEAEHECIICIRGPNRGVSAARNLGIKASTADLVAFLDSDDVWRPNKLESQIQVLSHADRNVGFVHSSFFLIDENGLVITNYAVVPPTLRGDIFLPALLGYCLSGSASSVIVFRDILDKAGYFDEELFFGEDWDLWTRLARISWVDFTPEAVVGIRVHDKSATRRPQPGRALKFFRQKMKVYGKWEGILAGSKCFRSSLRRDAIDAILPMWRTPLELYHFYRGMASSLNPIEANVFSNLFDFLFMISIRVFGILWGRLRKKGWFHD